MRKEKGRKMGAAVDVRVVAGAKLDEDGKVVMDGKVGGDEKVFADGERQESGSKVETYFSVKRKEDEQQD